MFVVEVLFRPVGEHHTYRPGRPPNTTTVCSFRGSPGELWGLLGRLWHPRFGQTVVVFRYLSLFCCCVCCCGAPPSFERPKTRNTTTVWPARGAPEELWGLLGRLWHPCVGQTVVTSSQGTPESNQGATKRRKHMHTCWPPSLHASDPRFLPALRALRPSLRASEPPNLRGSKKASAGHAKRLQLGWPS